MCAQPATQTSLHSPPQEWLLLMLLSESVHMLLSQHKLTSLAELLLVLGELANWWRVMPEVTRMDWLQA